ncbi:hypothetical protein NW766_009549 [Fusarium irregulare]|uniref:C2H2-type domain-containing protein n=1 Tax=Fusarium irregulare TaxID=2494466 RepID=A0A9W8PI53_9HYPO|nr:hypothetical protein NW766_009549 [Fusarium irregulare]
MTPAARRRLAEIIGNLPGIIRNQSQLADEFQFPPPTIPPIPELDPPQPDGRGCRICQLVFRDDQKIQQHYTTQHSWTNPQGRGRPRVHDAYVRPEKPWREGVMCQRFFRSRAASGWFEVGRSRTGRGYVSKSNATVITKQPMRSSKVSPETRAHIDEVLKRDKMYRDAETQPRFYSKTLGDDSFAATSLWLERTRWPIMFKNVRRDILLAMTRLPIHAKVGSVETDYVLGQGPFEGDTDIIISREDEKKITCLLSAIDIMLDRCELTAQHTSRVLLCRLASSRLDIYQPKPFALRIEENTRKRYRLLWKRFIAFALRAYLLPDAIREKEVNIRLDGRIASQVQRLWEHPVWQCMSMKKPSWPRLHKLDDDPDIPQRYSDEDIEINSSGRHESPYDDDVGSVSFEESSDDFGSSEEDDGDFEESEREDRLNDFKHAEVFLELLFELSLSLSMENFIDGQPGSTLLIYFKYCPNLSGLIWVQRLLFLEYALPLRSYPIIGIQQRPQFPMERLNEVRQKYMVQGSMSPLAELHNLRNFGQKVAKTEPPPFLLRWSDDGRVVSYGSDFTLSMEDFRGLVDHLIGQAEGLCNELMCGFEPNFDINKIKDDFTNGQAGFSFVNHPENGLDEIYQELIVQLCTSRSARLAKDGQ